MKKQNEQIIIGDASFKKQYYDVFCKNYKIHLPQMDCCVLCIKFKNILNLKLSKVNNFKFIKFN